MGPHRTTRRTFLHQAAAATGLLALGAERARGADEAARARVGIARHPSVLTDQGVDAEIVGRMIDTAVCWLTGTEDGDRAWATLFSSDEVVGIKPNGLAGIACSTAYEVLAHCVQRLQGLGVKPDNILIWEDRPSNLVACGITPGERPWGVRAQVIHEDLTDPLTHGSLTDKLYAPLFHRVDAILNAPILKCHPICGVTLAMKNHYGSIGSPGQQHFDQCHTPIVDLSDMAPIRDRTRLVICDGTRARIEGQAYGEAQYLPNMVMAATDVVAHDAIGARLIDEERKRQGIRPLADAGLEPRYIRLAQERGIGIADLEAIQVDTIDLA